MDEKFEIKKVVLKRTWCVRRQIDVRRLRRMCVRTCIKGWHTIENWCIKVKENFQEMQRARRRKNVQRNALGNNKVLLSPMILSHIVIFAMITMGLCQRKTFPHREIRLTE